MIERQLSIYYGANYQHKSYALIFIITSVITCIAVAIDVYRDINSLILAYIENAFLDFALIFFITYVIGQYRSLKKQNINFLHNGKFDLSERHHTICDTKVVRKLIPFILTLLFCSYINEVFVFIMITQEMSNSILLIITLIYYVTLSLRCVIIPLSILIILKNDKLTLPEYIAKKMGIKYLQRRVSAAVGPTSLSTKNEGNVYFLKLQSQWN
uniref:7TM_GPCR_Srx domain-containing protein n=1 Tax=Parastrongyloides trichosuri TaxID=131310 RepID=A0A0N5A1B0_PARTI